MDDAMIISCGHSVGNAGRRRVMETVSSNLFLHSAGNSRVSKLCRLWCVVVEKVVSIMSGHVRMICGWFL